MSIRYGDGHSHTVGGGKFNLILLPLHILSLPLTIVPLKRLRLVFNSLDFSKNQER
jgi:hypothetical protein